MSNPSDSECVMGFTAWFGSVHCVLVERVIGFDEERVMRAFDAVCSGHSFEFSPF